MMKMLVAAAVFALASVPAMAGEYVFPDTAKVNAQLEQQVRERLESELAAHNLDEHSGEIYVLASDEQLMDAGKHYRAMIMLPD